MKLSKTDKQTLKRITKNWEFFIEHEKNLYNTNIQHCLAGSMQTAYDFLWMIKKLNSLKDRKDRS